MAALVVVFALKIHFIYGVFQDPDNFTEGENEEEAKEEELKKDK